METQIYTVVSTGLDPSAQEALVICISPVTLSLVLDLLRPDPGLAFCPASWGLQGPLSQDAESVLRAKSKPSLRFLPLTYQVAAPPCRAEPSQGFCTLAVHNQARAGSLAEMVWLGGGGRVVGGWHTSRGSILELVERWQRVVGSRGPCSPRRSPHGAHFGLQGHPEADLEPLSPGGGQEEEPTMGHWPWGFLGDPGFPGILASPSQAEAMGKGTCLP